MLKDLNVDLARFVALLAKAARAERDAMLGHGPDKDLNGTTATRGERDPTDPLPAQDSQLKALRDALGALAEAARSKLYTLMRIGQGHLAPKKWHHGVEEAQLIGDTTVTGALIEDPDLHDQPLERPLRGRSQFVSRNPLLKLGELSHLVSQAGEISRRESARGDGTRCHGSDPRLS